MHFKFQDLSDPEIPFDLPSDGQASKLLITAHPSDGFEKQVSNMIYRLNQAALGLEAHRLAMREKDRKDAIDILCTPTDLMSAPGTRTYSF